MPLPFCSLLVGLSYPHDVVDFHREAMCISSSVDYPDCAGRGMGVNPSGATLIAHDNKTMKLPR